MTYRLEGLGRLPWVEVCGAIGRATCSWVDLDGIQVGPVPPAAPPCTHLWAWEEDRWIRVRVDSTEGIVGVLTHGGGSGGEPVAVYRRLVRTWRPDEDARAGPLPKALAGREVELLTTRDLRPVTFVQVPGLDGQAAHYPSRAPTPGAYEASGQCVGRVSDGGNFVAVSPFAALSWD